MKTTARDLLLSMIAPKTAALANTTPEDAVANAIHEALINQPSLRRCLHPGCLREFDMTARMNGQEPARPSWSGDGWHQVTRGIAHGALCPDHVHVVTAHMPRTVELPEGRWTVDCACGWLPAPVTWHGLLKAMWEQHLLTVTGKIPALPELATPPERTPLAGHTEDTLTELYDRLEDAEDMEARTMAAARDMLRGWANHRQILGGVSTAVSAVCNHIRVDDRDWTANQHDAWIYAVLIGWDDDTLTEIAVKHRWNEERVKYIREMRALLAPITDPQPKENEQP